MDTYETKRDEDFGPTREEYEAPRVTEVGALHEVTLLQGKNPGSPSDFNFPGGLSFVFS